MKRVQLEALQWIRDCSVEQACGSLPFTHATLAALLRRDLVVLERQPTGTRCWALTDTGRTVLLRAEVFGLQKHKVYVTGPLQGQQLANRILMRPARHRRR